MAKKKVIKTNAIRMVEQKKISYVEHTYEWSEDHISANDVAAQMDGRKDKIYKTLVAVGNNTGTIVAVIAGNKEVDLKKLAKASGNKRVEMLHVKELEDTTGYIRGGCSPVGMKKLFPTFIDQSAEDLDTMIVSAGKRGLQMEISPKDLAQLVRAKFEDILA